MSHCVLLSKRVLPAEVASTTANTQRRDTHLTHASLCTRLQHNTTGLYNTTSPRETHRQSRTLRPAAPTHALRNEREREATHTWHPLGLSLYLSLSTPHASSPPPTPDACAPQNASDPQHGAPPPPPRAIGQRSTPHASSSPPWVVFRGHGPRGSAQRRPTDQRPHYGPAHRVYL